MLSTRVTELLADRAGIVGLRAEGPDRPVERRGPVVLATSSFDWNAALVEEVLRLDGTNFASLAPDSIRGDGITLARAVGAAVAKIPVTWVPMVPG